MRSASSNIRKPANSSRSEKIDRLLTSKYLGIPIFLLIMMLIFWLTFSVLGAPLQDLLSGWIDSFTAFLEAFLVRNQVTPWLISLLINGVCAGVGSVLSFLPIIVPAVLLPLFAGGQRLYGKGCLCDG